MTARAEPDEAPTPIRHAAPDVELAEAQMALGRPELAEENDVDEEEFELEAEEAAEAADAEAADAEAAIDHGGGGAGGSGSGRANGARFGGEPPASPGGELAAPSPAAPVEHRRPGNRLINFLLGSWRELQRVQWPDRRQVIQATGVVIGFVIVAGVFLGVADALAAKLMDYILNH